MSIFSKLFGKKEKKTDEKKPEPVTMTTSIATFYFHDTDPEEIGYEGEIDWYDLPEDEKQRESYQPAGCYFDSDTPETTEASICYKRLEGLFEDRYETDKKVKLGVIEHYAGDGGAFARKDGKTYSKEELMDDLKIRFISLYRDGRVVYSLRQNLFLEDHMSDIHVICEPDGSVSYKNDKEYYAFSG